MQELDIRDEVHMLMGWDLTWGTCDDCGYHRELGENHLCMHCTQKVVQEDPYMLLCRSCFNTRMGSSLICKKCQEETESVDNDGICPKCVAEEEWHNNADFSVTVHCKDCADITDVNNNGLCLDCYLISKQIRKCETCDKTITGNSNVCNTCKDTRKKNTQNTEKCVNCGRYNRGALCANCDRHCIACDEPFVPVVRTQIHCIKCISKKHKNICVSCDKYSRYLDEGGFCPTCIPNKRSQPFCDYCKVNPVDYEYLFCKGCQDDVKFCPVCLTTKISAVEYTCQECDEKRINSSRSY